ncbi:hypothetical protein LIA77_11641 [Sarocladium implicatum]|nr:hypothetical protein LIA77_11641 [Sarocladium implicatum]
MTRPVQLESRTCDGIHTMHCCKNEAKLACPPRASQPFEMVLQAHEDGSSMTMILPNRVDRSWRRGRCVPLHEKRRGKTGAQVVKTVEKPLLDAGAPWLERRDHRSRRRVWIRNYVKARQALEQL